ncbi:hypothetical protein C8F01DRAFT_1353290 [Mycena amicta]|nr:hypothetical protein C8F01DRAFT_1353290 [Mycena amicta]
MSDVVDVQLADLTSSVPQGQLTVKQLCDFVGKAERSVQDAKITDISWFGTDSWPLAGHHFVLLRFVHTTSSGGDRVYYVRLERAGFIPSRIAQGRATITTVSPTSESGFFDGFRMYLALCRSQTSELAHPKRKGGFPLSPWARVDVTTAMLPRFTDFLDYKWRGPPATLSDLARYLRIIPTSELRYSLGTTDNFAFARIIVHLIALRHYSFQWTAFGVPFDALIKPKFDPPRHLPGLPYDEWKKHDPSTIGLVFRTLHRQERQNALRRFWPLLWAISFLPALSVFVGFGKILFSFFYKAAAVPKGWAIFIAFLLGLIPSSFTLVISLNAKTKYIVPPLVRTMRRGTKKIVGAVELLDNNPEAARGDFEPSIIPLSRFYQRATLALLPIPENNNGEPSVDSPHYVPEKWRQVVSDDPRALPDLWEREAQIYPPGRTDYEQAFYALEVVSSGETSAEMLDYPIETFLQGDGMSTFMELLERAVLDPSLRGACVKKVYDLCETEVGSIAVLDADIFPIIRGWGVSNKAPRLDISRWTCRVIARIAGFSGLIPRLLKLDLPEYLIGLLSANRELIPSPDQGTLLPDHAMYALVPLVKMPFGAESVLDAGVLPFIEDILASKSPNDDFKSRCCALVASLAGLRHIRGPIPRLLVGLLRYLPRSLLAKPLGTKLRCSKPAKLRTEALRALCVISAQPNGARDLSEAGLFGANFTFLLQCRTNKIRSRTLLLLGRLADCGDADFLDRVSQNAGYILSFLSESEPTVPVIKSLIGFLVRVSREPTWRAALKSSGAVVALYDLRIQIAGLEDQEYFAEHIDLCLTHLQHTSSSTAASTSLLNTTAGEIFRDNRFRELVVCISKARGVDGKSAYLDILIQSCDTPYGADAAIAAGAIALARDYLWFYSVELQIRAVKVLGTLGKNYPLMALPANFLPELVQLLGDRNTDPRLQATVISALAGIAENPFGREVLQASGWILHLRYDGAATDIEAGDPDRRTTEEEQVSVRNAEATMGLRREYDALHQAYEHESGRAREMQRAMEAQCEKLAQDLNAVNAQRRAAVERIERYEVEAAFEKKAEERWKAVCRERDAALDEATEHRSTAESHAKERDKLKETVERLENNKRDKDKEIRQLRSEARKAEITRFEKAQREAEKRGRELKEKLSEKEDIIIQLKDEVQRQNASIKGFNKKLSNAQTEFVAQQKLAMQLGLIQGSQTNEQLAMLQKDHVALIQKHEVVTTECIDLRSSVARLTLDLTVCQRNADTERESLEKKSTAFEEELKMIRERVSNIQDADGKVREELREREAEVAALRQKNLEWGKVDFIMEQHKPADTFGSPLTPEARDMKLEFQDEDLNKDEHAVDVLAPESRS